MSKGILELSQILESLKNGNMSVSRAKKLLSLYSLEKIDNLAKFDLGRKNRKGIPEVVLGESKTFDEIKKIVQKVLTKSDSIMISRLKETDYKKIVAYVKKKKLKTKVGKNTTSILIFKKLARKTGGKVGIITAGTSDIGVAEEARLMCEAMNCTCFCSYDIGVAGIHRMIPALKSFVKNDVDSIVVIAGMEGALATIVSSLSDIPVIGVPTSIGYGYGEKGTAALAAMLQSCALGLSVVNIDNGIGGGAIASTIANRAVRNIIKH